MLKPVYESKRCTLYRADALDVIEDLPVCDLLVTDPPCGVMFESKCFSPHALGCSPLLDQLEAKGA